MLIAVVSEGGQVIAQTNYLFLREILNTPDERARAEVIEVQLGRVYSLKKLTVFFRCCPRIATLDEVDRVSPTRVLPAVPLRETTLDTFR